MPFDPVIFMAFSHDPNRELPGVPEEYHKVMSIFDRTSFFPLNRWQVRQDEIESVFEKYASKLRIFHFSGHADPTKLQVNNFAFKPVNIFSEGLSRNLGLFCREIKLVFLNGCSTEEQAKFFINKGVPAVIATSRPVRDTIACAFANRFYQKFTSEGSALTLQLAFEATLNSIETEFGLLRPPGKKMNYDLLDDLSRGIFNLKKTDNEPLYKLHINPNTPAIASETFSDWGGKATQATGNIRKADDASQIKSGGVDAKSYLLCNRSRQYPEFEKALQQKRAGQAPDPFFFFVHAEEKHCPDDLPERFTYYGLPAICRQNGFAEEIVLSEPDLFIGGNPADPDNPTRDLFKTHLSELYKSCFQGEEAHDNLLCKLMRRPGDEEVLVVLHRLSPEEWSDYCDPALRAELNGKIETLLRYYIGDFSRYLRDGFSERLIVVFSVQYYDPDPFFPDLFQRLETEFTPSRVKVLGNLPPVSKTDIKRWQDEVLQEQFFLINDIFMDRKGERANELPFFDAKKILSAQIEHFNSTKAANVHT